MIYFVRHGSTEWNKFLKCQGRADIALSAEGIKQASETKNALDKVKFSAYFCSPLKRARQTFEIITGREPLKNELDNRLIERDFGEFEGKTRSEFDFDGFWSESNFYKNFNAENLCDFHARVKDFYDLLYNKYKDVNVLVVSHGGVGFIFNSFFFGVPKSKIYSHAEIKNGGYKCYDWTD